MNKARKKFILFSELAIILLLTVLLTVINVLSFTMAAEDADRVTEHLAMKHGSFEDANAPRDMQPPQDESSPLPNTSTGAPQSGTDNSGSTRRSIKPFRLNDGTVRMGPDSEEMKSSLRYFTAAIDKKGNVSLIEYRISAVTEDEARQWAESLQYGSETGWTNMTYRYRVYNDDDKTYVTVIDQSRELYPSYRLLIISIAGGAVMIVISLLVLLFIGKKLFRPVEEADRKQKQFIARLENEFKLPLTIINADTETLERSIGKNERTSSIDKQVKRMTSLVKELGALSVFEEGSSKTKTELSDLMTAILENHREEFGKKNISLSYDIEPDICVMISDVAMQKVINELIANALKFSVSKVRFTLKKHKDRIKLTASNDTRLPDGSCDQIFDRFTTLDNAGSEHGAGLGLSYVKEVIKSGDGRVSASVKNGIITIVSDL